MSSNPKKSGGGPRTAMGKDISSQNALVHGSTSNNVVSDGQKILVEQYVQELTTYYHPESPLEKFQIQRIALCKAKLDALYEIEQVKLQIASEDLKRAPDLVMQKISASDDMTKEFAQSLSAGRKLDLPMGLSPELIAAIASEINASGGKLEDDDDLNVALPSLSRFINDVASRLGLTAHRALLRLGNSANELLKEKSSVGYQLKQLLDSMYSSRQEEVCGEPQKDESLPGENEDLDINKINEALSGIAELNSVVVSAHEVAKNFSRMQELMLRSVTLSGEESDRLLRYQTTWERRLSSAIGELLALQARNAK
jgi:hypothetical protein